MTGARLIALPNQTWVCSPAFGKANLKTPSRGEGKCCDYCRHRARNSSLSINGLFLQASLVAQAVKNLTAMRKTWVRSLWQKDPLEKKWQPTPVFLPGKSQRQRSLAGYSSCDHQESDTTERLRISFSLLGACNKGCICFTTSWSQ